MLTNQVSTAIVLDLRSKKKNNTYPVKLRITFNRSPRMYSISIKLSDDTIVDSLTTDDLERVKSQKKVKDAQYTFNDKDTYLDISNKINAKQQEAREIIKKLENFEFDIFRDIFIKKKAESQDEPENVFWQYNRTVKALEENNQLGTASNYNLSCKSLKRFIKAKDNTEIEPKVLLFRTVTKDFLEKYEDFMYNDGKDDEKGKAGKSATTISMYLRALRTIFNSAIEEKVIEPELYPFSRTTNDKKHKYQIPTGNNIKKALNKEDLKKLFHAKAITPEQEKAKDFWFFSYTCNGMNVKDICLLRNENIKVDSLNFLRAKTKKTKKAQREVIVIITDFAKIIIEKYRMPDPNPRAFVFPILSLTDIELTKRKEIQAFTRFINQHIKILASSVGITSDISTYFARHSFATQAIQNGASIEFVSEAFSHSNINTTRGYFAGFADNTKKDLMEGLMNFQ